ncbi:MAG TPA: M56 family metallopeptidase, partial [Candidatus Angelobacter sp.]|nr:M56 family metallopeptidase [Candidatus Angelobacter sp.]
MTLLSVLHVSKDLLVPLGESALRSIAAAGVAALVLALLPSKRSIVRLRVWTGVLYIALAMPLLGVVLPHFNVAIPETWFGARPAHSAAVPVEPSPSAKEALVTAPAADFELHRAPATSQKGQQDTVTKPLTADSNSHPVASAYHVLSTAKPQSSIVARMSRVNWGGIALAIYFLGLAILLVRLLLGIRGSRKLAASASDISPRYFPRKGELDDPHISAASDFVALQSQRAALRVAPHLKQSPALLVPATVGIRKPVILLPADWREWSREKLEAVLSHEISHVARRDALTQLLSALHCALFWFSPLPWWLDRQITDLAEQASDEAALAGGADRTLYAETLLGFFSQLERGAGRVRWHALSMASSESSSGDAERRVDRILAWRPAGSMKKSFIAVSLVCAVPVIFLIASLRPSVTAQAAEPAKAVRVASAANTPAALPTSVSQTVRTEPVVQAAPAAKANSAQPKDDQTSEDSNTVNVHSGFYNSGPRYVIIHGNSNSVTMSGDDEDLHHARALREKINGDFIWFERDEKPYVITDPAFLSQVKALFAPQEELEKQQDALGRQQDELGRQQDDLGRQQDQLGDKMETVSVKVPDISPDLERIHARLKQLQAGGATQSELGSVQSQIGELQSRLGRLQSQAGQQQSVIGGQQSELGQKQSELGRKQGELGRQQGELGRRQGELARQAS